MKVPEFNDLLEVDAMLSETVIEWTKKWKEEGLAAGRVEGRVEGRAEGIAEGIEKGIEKGRVEIAKRMLAKGLEITLVAEVTGLAPEELKKIISRPDSVCEPATAYSPSSMPRKRSVAPRAPGQRAQRR